MLIVQWFAVADIAHWAISWCGFSARLVEGATARQLEKLMKSYPLYTAS